MSRSGLAFEFGGPAFHAALLQAPMKLTQELDKAVGRSVLTLARTAKIKAPKAHSDLTNSIKSIQPSPLEGHVASGMAHATLVAEQTGAQGVPPEQSILDWIRVKNIEPNDPEMDQQDLAYVIARSISAKGTPADDYLVETMAEHKDEVNSRFDQAIARALEAI